MPEQPDYKQAGEIYRKSMEEAMAHIDRLSEELSLAREQAIDQEFAAKQELQRIQSEAEKLSQAHIDQHRKEYDTRIRNEVLMQVTEKLIQAGRSASELKQWLGITPAMISDVWMRLGFEPLGDRAANVTYENSGRTGYVHFNWDGILLRFYFEFSGGNSLATIDVPSAEDWESETGIAGEHRRMILEFIANRVIRDQAPDHHFEITATYIHVYK